MIRREFDNTERTPQGESIYSTDIDDNYLIFDYNGDGGSFIRLCFNRDCKISDNPNNYQEPFFELELDENGNTGNYVLNYLNLMEQFDPNLLDIQ